MSPRAKKILFISIGVATVAGIGVAIYLATRPVPPALIVTGWNTTANPGAPFGTYTFGSAQGDTTMPASHSSGTWTVTSSGNTLTIANNGSAYKTVTLTGLGPVAL